MKRIPLAALVTAALFASIGYYYFTAESGFPPPFPARFSGKSQARSRRVKHSLRSLKNTA